MCRAERIVIQANEWCRNGERLLQKFRKVVCEASVVQLSPCARNPRRLAEVTVKLSDICASDVVNRGFRRGILH